MRDSGEENVKAPHPVDATVGRNLRLIRVRTGYTQQELANAMNLTFQQIQKYESGRNRISAPRLYDAARALGVNIESFFDGLPRQSVKAIKQKPDSDLRRLITAPGGLKIARAYIRLNPDARRLLLELTIALGQAGSGSR